MTDFTALAERYLAAWNEQDTGLRVKAIAELWAEDGGYTDPLADVTGHDQITAVIAGAQAMFPGHLFSLAGPVDGHGHQARFTWHLTPVGAAEPTAIGFDVAVLTDDGRLSHVYGFLDKVPS